MKINISLEIPMVSKKMAENIILSLNHDISMTSDHFERSNIDLSSKGNIIYLNVEANDLIAAKATINSSISWLDNSLKIFKKYSI